ncbi:MAG: 3-oxo-tetronate kinase [Hellea sp.]
MVLRLGCIADDITGGTDLALALSSKGLKVVQILGQASGYAPDADAVVISLKIRTAPVRDAVAAANQACETLQQWESEQIYFKYCSTFDSTQEGNIGPIAEALAAHIGADTIPFVPSFPGNGRIVRGGYLYVNQQLISDSPMKDHPLTPMTEPDLCIHLRSQIRNAQVDLIALEIVEEGPIAVKQTMQDCAAAGSSFLIVDSVTKTHLNTVALACTDLSLLTGGSAFAGAIAANFNDNHNGDNAAQWHPTQNGPIAILSGSCSAASNEQVQRAAKFHPVFKLAITSHLPSLIHDAKNNLDAGTILISSTAEPNQVVATQAEYGKDNASKMIERSFGEIASALYEHGVRTFIIGGGETSGAVAAALGLKALNVGPEIAPGVPWMIDAKDSGIQIAFKSGNFGGPDFFNDAIHSLKLRWS